MPEEGNRRGGTLGALWGCALSTVVGVPLVTGMFLFSALGDCAEGETCHHGSSLLRLLLLAILIAVGIGFGTRLLVNVTFRRLRAMAATGSDRET